MTETEGAERLRDLTERYGKLDGADLLRPFLEREFPGRIALVSSFGAEAAVLLQMAAEIDRSLPVIFLDTGKLFGETLRYRDLLAKRLGLTDLRVIKPEEAAVMAADPEGVLWDSDPTSCCGIRKVAPLRKALAGFDAWISGRKRFHGDLRAFMPVIELSGAKIKINPLARWSKVRIEEEFARHDLPAPSPGGRRLPLHRLPALHRPRRPGRRLPRRPLGRPREDGVRDSPVRG